MMRDEYDRRLVRLKQKHAWLFAGENIGHWIESGWLGLFEDLCAKIEAAVPPECREGVFFTQIKEKFGGLRVYLNIASIRFDVINLGKGYEFWQGGGLYETLRPIIYEAEQASQTICQFCGAIPAQAVHHGRLIITQCPAHAPFDRDALIANFALFTNPGISPVPPSLGEVETRLLAARSIFAGHGVRSLSVVGPGSGPAQDFAVVYAPAIVGRSGVVWREIEAIVGWPSAAIPLDHLDRWRDVWHATGGGADISWLWSDAD